MNEVILCKWNNGNLEYRLRASTTSGPIFHHYTVPIFQFFNFSVPARLLPGRSERAHGVRDVTAEPGDRAAVAGGERIVTFILNRFAHE